MLFEASRRGARIGEVPIIFVERRLGVSKMSLAVILESMITPWRLQLRNLRQPRAVSTRHRVVMVATSYPRFEGDTVGTFMEPIARGVAARGHEVHIVLPWHPRFARPRSEHGVTFHPFHYAPTDGAARVRLCRRAARRRAPARRGRGHRARWPWPPARCSPRRVARQVEATIDARALGRAGRRDGGVGGAATCRSSSACTDRTSTSRRRTPSRGASRAYVLERAGAVIACSDDLRVRAIALGAAAERAETVPYGVDAARFAPDARARARRSGSARASRADDRVVFAVGRFVRKKGFEYLIDAVGRLAHRQPRLRLVLAGWGDLEGEYRVAHRRAGLADRVLLPGLVPHDGVAGWLAAADVVAVPSIRDDAGNVDGLPNVVLEALASGTPVVATRAGGIGSVIADGVTGLLVGERDPEALASAIDRLLGDAALAASLGATARSRAMREGGWEQVAARIEAAYDRAADTAGPPANPVVR